MDNKKKIELSDEEIKKVNGGTSGGDYSFDIFGDDSGNDEPSSTSFLTGLDPSIPYKPKGNKDRKKW